jgi:hypothetical protein
VATSIVNEQQRLFLAQARSNFEVYRLLASQEKIPESHSLHYLQMVGEMLGKAYFWTNGPNFTSHRAFASFHRALALSRSIQRRLGFQGKNAAWESLIREGSALAETVENLAPSLTDGPNPEYPWPRDHPLQAPCEYQFEIWTTLRQTPRGRGFLALLDRLLESADSWL